MWGLANNMTDTLLAAFKRILSMSDLQTSLVQFAFYGAYFCLALPGAILIKRYSYKTGILVGLGLFICGSLLFYPASKTMVYGHFLLALYILAGGLSILETTANPYIIAMGPEESSTQRLNLAQSFNPVGSIIGVLLSQQFILTNLNLADASQRASMEIEELRALQSYELTAVMGPYVGVAGVLLLLWLTIAVMKMPKASDEEKRLDFLPTLSRLFQKKHYTWGVISQFFYVGAQICTWSFTIRYVMAELNVTEAEAANYYLIALVVFLASRFITTWLMQFIQPALLLGYLAILAMIFTFVVIVGSGYAGVIALIGVSACMSLMFPTIFGLASKGLGKDTKIGGSGLIMAILGGALLPILQGAISDATGSIHISYVVPMLCFLVVVYYSFFSSQYNNPELVS